MKLVAVFVLLHFVTKGSYAQIDFNSLMASISTEEGLKEAIVLPEKVKETFVNAHNKLRGQTANGELEQPPAANMNAVVWDQVISNEMEPFAQKCDSVAHKGNQAFETSYKEYLGQNLYKKNNVDTSSVDALVLLAEKTTQKWYDEYKDYKYPTYTTSPVVGHYTTLVNAKTSSIGCTMTLCKDGFVHTYCNYRPGNPDTASPPYIEGPACSQCPAGTSCIGSGLCGFQFLEFPQAADSPTFNYAEPNTLELQTLAETPQTTTMTNVGEATEKPPETTEKAATTEPSECIDLKLNCAYKGPKCARVDAYMGERNVSYSGHKCKTWPDKYQLAGKACRNPDKDQRGPWCYVEGCDACARYCFRECRL